MAGSGHGIGERLVSEFLDTMPANRWNDTSVEAPDDDAILRAVLSIVDGKLDGEQVFLAHGPEDDERILSVAA